MEQIISFQNLEVAPYTVEQLLDVRIDHRMNEHSTFYFKALLPEEIKDSYAKNSSQGSNVKLQVIRDGGKREILFQGMVRDLEVSAVQGSYYIEVSAVSYSCLLDTGKKSRSFQDKKMPYRKLIEQVAAGYPGAVLKDVVTQGAAIGQLIVQYEETDWEFLKRLASHFHTGLVANVHLAGPGCYVGAQNHGTLTLDAFNYTVKQHAAKYLTLSQNGVPGLREQDFIYYQADAYVPADLGDEVRFQGQTLYVYQVSGRVEKGIFLFHLTLTTKNGMSQPYRPHDRIAGSSVNAKITEIQNIRFPTAVFSIIRWKSTRFAGILPEHYAFSRILRFILPRTAADGIVCRKSGIMCGFIFRTVSKSTAMPSVPCMKKWILPCSRARPKARSARRPLPAAAEAVTADRETIRASNPSGIKTAKKFG